MSILNPPQTLALNTDTIVSFAGQSVDNYDWVVLSNNSPFINQIACGGMFLHCPAWYHYPIPFIDGKGNRLYGLTGSLIVTPIQQTIQGSGLTSTLFTTLYNRGETPPITVPTPLGGSPINVPGIANQLINHADPSGTVEIALSPPGDAQNAFAVTIDGIVAIGDAAHGGSLSVVGPITATGNIQGDTTNNLNFDSRGHAGVFKVSGVQEAFWDSSGFVFNNDLHFPAGVGLATNNDLLMKGGVVKADTSKDLNIDTTTGANKILMKSAGSLIADINSGGITLDAGTLTFLVGSISRVSKFTGTATTTPTLFNHGLGVVPDLVLISFNSTSATVHTFAIDYATLTSTQAKITSDGTNPFVAVAIKF